MRVARAFGVLAVLVAAAVGSFTLTSDPVSGGPTRSRSRTSLSRRRTTTRKPAATVKPVPSTKAVPSTKPVPSTFTVATGALTEASGCALSRADPNTVWLHNDSGNAPQLFALDLTTKALRVVDVVDAKLVDWEDIAALPGGGLLVGDIGDNDMKRASVQFYRIANLAGSTFSAQVQTLTYEDGPHNAEALVVDPTTSASATGPAVYVITKDETGHSGVYRADGNVLRKVAPLTIADEAPIFGNLITAADSLPDGSGVVLRTYQYAYMLKRPAGKPFEAAFSATPVRINVPFLAQAEAICVLQDGKTALSTTESRGATELPFVYVALP